MKTIKLLVISMLLIFKTLLATESSKIYWSENDLTWSDFTEMNLQPGSELIINYEYYQAKYKLGDTIVTRYKADFYINKDLSWVNPLNKTYETLRYHQVTFDLMELYRRKLQFALDRVEIPYMAEEKYRTIYINCQDMIEEFKKDTENGRNLSKLNKWKTRVENELSYQQVKKLPEFKKRNLGIGLSIGLGSSFFTNSISNYFTPAYNNVFGFDLLFKKCFLSINTIHAVNRTKLNYFNTNNLYENQRNDIGIFDISCGYVLLNNQHIKLIPFTGYVITQVETDSEEIPGEIISFENQGLIFGINCDYKLKKFLYLVPNMVNSAKQYNEICIRTRLSVARVNYYSNLSGYAVNLSAGFSLFGQLLKIE